MRENWKLKFTGDTNIEEIKNAVISTPEVEVEIIDSLIDEDKSIEIDVALTGDRGEIDLWLWEGKHTSAHNLNKE